MKHLLLICLTLLPAAAFASDYTLDLSKSTKSLKVGEKGQLVVQIKLKPEGHISDGSPITVVIDKHEDIKLDKNQLTRDEMEKNSSFEFRFPLNALKGGSHTLKGSVRFFLCAAECKKEDKPFSHTLEVSAQTKSGSAPGKISNLAGN